MAHIHKIFSFESNRQKEGRIQGASLSFQTLTSPTNTTSTTCLNLRDTIVYLNTNPDSNERIEPVSWQMTTKPGLIFNTETSERCDLYMRNRRCFVNKRITWQNTISTVRVIQIDGMREEKRGCLIAAWGLVGHSNHYSGLSDR